MFKEEVIKLIDNILFTTLQISITFIIGFAGIVNINRMLSSKELQGKLIHAFWASLFTYLLLRIWSYKWDSEKGQEVERFPLPGNDRIKTNDIIEVVAGLV